MENISSYLPEIHKEHNIISLEAFKSQKVNTPLLYRDGGPITRDDIASWFVRGFALSRGDEDVQYAFVRWSAARTGLNFRATLDNFAQAGSGKCLSEKEKQLLEKSYNNVRLHGEIDRRMIEEGEIDAIVGPVEMLGHYANEFTNEDGSEKEYQASLLEDFPSLDVVDNLTRSEFMKWADGRYKKTLAARAERERISAE